MSHPVLSSARTNRSRRFTLEEREENCLVGLVHPAGPRSLQHEIHRVLQALSNLPNSLSRYQFLMHVLASDEQLFFAAVQTNVRRLLPMIYTPTVGEACQRYSDLHIPLRGLWIGIDQRGRVDQVLSNWPEHSVKAIVVSDCERILGLGDLGANGMGIPVGKLLLYTACGGINPENCLPVVLDVGCNNQSIRDNDNYIGLDQDRVTGAEYDDFVEEFMNAAVERFGKSCLIQFEDFGNANALRLLDKYRNRVCSFNDDIQGTAAVGLAGILSALRVEDVYPTLGEHKFLFLGAGSAGIGIARLIVLALKREGMPEEEAKKKCWFVDSRGLVYEGRANVSSAKRDFAHKVNDDVAQVGNGGLLQLVKVLKPTALIGVSTIAGSFTEEVIREMAHTNKKPIVFALSNPTSKAECTAEDAYKYSDGRAIYASGSPFAPVKLQDGRTMIPGQGNNAYIFPGIGLGVLLSQTISIPDSMLLAAADTLSTLVDAEQLDAGCMYPDLSSLLDISAAIAKAVCDEAVQLGLNQADVSKMDLGKIRQGMYEPGRLAF
ncbi:NADP-dependent malic enzyme [Gracilariopsis chorda]|uniref:Malic enzyme n=2 Tax=Gracilariopsis TaxID=2781 RepID=A0A2V3J6D4_9FLOR|nr:malic enzyme [Gracilariopsis lemaneiformis]PXF48940.1 NADP-dependent malic enzyme [Gracilariopsis chorda]|eukprot:PXF48940.1 NADP-dependent malic enzyme [Gracilariopsis chorda]